MKEQIGKVFEMLKNNEISSKDAHKQINDIKNSNKSETPLIPTELLSYSCQWEKFQLSYSTIYKEGLNNLIIFTTDNSFENIYKEIVDEDLSKIKIVKAAKKYTKISDWEYEVNPESYDDYISLFSELLKQEFYPESILHLWTVDNKFSSEYNIGQGDELLNLGVNSLFYIVNSIHKLESRSLRKLIVATNSSEKENPFDYSIKGFTPSIVKAMPKLVFSTIEVPFQNLGQKEAYQIILKELSITEGTLDLDIKYEANQRYVKKINNIELKNNDGINIKNEGVYLITGGAGGLGLIFSQYLIDKYKAKLVLTGRSELNEKRKEIINDIKKNGGEVLYLQADVGNKKAMENVINTTKKQYGHIDGIIHTSGLFCEKLIIQKDIEEFKKVLWPKVDGTLVLDEVTKDEDIDFMLMFSSTSAIIGDFGQGDYAVANKFLDGFTSYRENLRKDNKRKGITKVINWPLWKEGGMHFDSKSEALYLQSSGMLYLENKDGFEVFENILGSQLTQAVIFAGDRNKIQRIIDTENNGRKIVKDKKKDSVNSNFKSYASKGLSIEKRLEYDILKITSDTIGIDVSKLDLDENIGNYGFDSIGLKEFADKLSEFFDLEILPIIFFDRSTLKEIIDYFYIELNEQLKNLYEEDDKSDINDKTDNTVSKIENEVVSTIKNEELLVRNNKEPVAIIGISGKFPDSNNIKEFWDNMESKKDLIKEIPLDRWDWRDYFDETTNTYENYPRWGGFIEDIDKFDASFFNLSRREAEFMDPKQRLLMQSVWETIEDAGYKASHFSGKKVGVFIGAQANEYQELLPRDRGPIAQHVTGNVNSLLSNRLSFILNFRGPSETIDTACSSSLVAIHRAVKSIQNGESELAVAGGISLIQSPNVFIGTINLGILSPDGKCKTFDKSANGYVKGEGLSTILLKPLSKAIQDKDNIYAIIRGTAEGHGGKANSLTAPNSDAQAELLTTAYIDAGINPETITYYEAHGTGTELGDPVEIQGIKKAFLQDSRNKTYDKYCAIGSVKTNIGHLEPASGVAGLIKVILCMQKERLLGIRNYKELNPYIKLEKTPFYIITDSKPWKRIKDDDGNMIPRRAGVSSFGFGGANAHIVIEEYKEDINEVINNNESQIIILSAKNEEKLKEYAEQILKYINDNFYKIETNNDIEEDQILLEMERDLIRIASDIINVSTQDIDSSETMDEYGFDLIKQTELLKRINEKYELDNMTSLNEKFISINEITDLLFNNYKKEIIKHYQYIKPNKCKEKNINLEEVAYTLQMGREDMSTRLAFVASNVEDLEEKLTAYINRKEDIEYIHTGIVENSKKRRKILVEGPEGQIYIKALLENKKLDKIAQIWVAGGEVNWDELHNNKKIKRISLPTYPFAKERYWISNNGEKVISLTNDDIISKLHPMIDKNTSTLEVQQFTTKLNGEEFYIKDHIINGEKIMPGVAYIEMARGAGELSVPSNIRAIRDIIWIKPILIQSPREIKIELYPKDDCIEYDIITINEELEKIVHGQGRLITGSIDEKQQESINLESIKNRCKTIYTKDLCYENYKKAGFEYGEGFKGIDKLYTGEGEVLALLKVPDSFKNSIEELILHPTLMDGALQSIIGLNANEDSIAYVPFTLGEVELLGELKDTCYAHIIYKENENTSTIRKYNIEIVDENGTILVKIKDFSCRAFSPSKEVAIAESKETIYLSSEWIEEELVKEKEIIEKNILIFDKDEEIANKLKEKYKEEKVILIKQGEEYKKVNELEYEINPKNQEDYFKLIKSIKEKDIAISHIIHLWNNETENNKNLDKKLEESVYSIFNICRESVKQKFSFKIIYAYNTENELNNPEYEAVESLLKTISLENSKIAYKTLAFDTKKIDILAKILISELEEESKDVMYKEGKRFVKSLNEIKDLSDELIVDNSLLKENGVYIITGGVGGLGFIFAEYLAKEYNANLVLTGRSELNEKKQLKIEELNKYGANVVYIKSDISRKEDVNKLISKTKEKFNEINGVIHSAGIIRDNYIVNKSKEDFEQVIAPKVYGTINIDEATKNEKLDFFAMFSSVASIFGNLGQADYSYANGFMDNYATGRDYKVKKGLRFGKTVSINWPLWRNGGMQVDSQTEKMIEESFGFKLLETEKGVNAFELSLNQDKSQFIVISGNKNKIDSLLLGEENLGKEVEEVLEIADKDLLKKVEKDIVSIISKILKTNEGEINLHKELSDFGFDSITFTEFGNLLNKKYNLKVMPSIFYEHTTPISLVKYLIKKYKKILTYYYSSNTIKDNVESKNQEISISEIPQYNNRSSKRFMVSSTKPDINDDIAIIGVSGRYPMADNLSEFWENFITAKDCITEIPKERWDYTKYYDPEKQKIGKSYCKWGGFINNVDSFDPLFFNISPTEARFMDPQERLFLETVHHTIEDSGYSKSRIRKSKVGVFVGVMYGEYQIYGGQEDLRGNPLSLSSSYSSIANRVSYYYDFKGPSVAIDTMCSSALTAVHFACESIYRGETEMAIAGGVNVTIHPNKYLLLCQSGLASSDGKCHSYGDNGDGYVPGEGTGAVLLKSLKKAEEDGDYIYGVIKGITVNHGGKSNGYAVPNGSSQADVILETIKKSGIDPRTISYIEGQGTGTPLGDSIEISSLTNAYREHTKDIQYCPIGSAKSNIGHLESAGGIAAVTKVLLQMKHKKLVPSLHSEKLNPNIDFEESPFYVQQELTDWKQPVVDGQTYPRRAGVNAFGAGGSNVHMIIEEYENKQLNVTDVTKKDNLIIISARNEDRLKAYVKDIYEYLENNKEDTQISNIAYTLQIGREALEERLAVIVSTTEELIIELQEYCNNKETSNIFKGNSMKNKSDLEQLFNGKEKEDYIRELMADNNLQKLAELWAKGADINWEQFYKEIKYNKISLPTYPFAKKSYWIPKFANEDHSNIELNNNNSEADEIKKESKNEVKDEVKNEELYEKVLKNISNYICDLLGLDEEDLDIDYDLEIYGMNSILMVQLANKIKKDYDNLSSYGIIFQEKTVKGMAENISKAVESNKSRVKVKEERSKNNKIKPRITEEETPIQKVEADLITDNIFINGVTGLLGGRMIKEYLETTDSNLYCLVRGDNKDKARERIWEMLKVYNPDKKLKSKFDQRVFTVLGDITKENLGLEEELYNKLANTIDMVVHIAAKITLHGFYEEVKEVNVDGTRNMIDFALRTKQKYFIHTSTIAVMGDRIRKNCSPFTEKDFNLGQEFEDMGYEQSKFEAEQMVRSSSKDGLKWVIARAGYIMGDSTNGYYPFGITSVPGVFYDYIKTAVEMKEFFDSPLFFDVTPVDYISRGLAYISTKIKNIYATYHLNNPNPSTINDIMSYVAMYGYEIDIIKFNKFIDKVKGNSTSYHSMTTELMLLNFEEDDDSYGYSSVDATYTKEVLEKGGIICPEVDEILMKTYLDYCIEIGYLDKPTKTENKKVDK